MRRWPSETAAIAGVAAPWLGVAPWWALTCVAAIVLATAQVLRRPVPALPVPWRVCVQVAGLLVVVESLSQSLHLPRLTAASLAALVLLSLAAALVASAANNLPASVVFASVLGSSPLPAFAALAGLSVGALATPHGSVATMIAFDRAGPGAEGLGDASFLKLWAPSALAATVAATALLWLITRA